jgi:ubiquinone biosynthesis protein
MEFMRGVKISEYAALDQLGLNRPQIAQLLINTYCQQVFVDGFFHADPHPGNLFVTPENRLIMIDFGMVGSIPEKLKEQLLQVAMAAVKGDFMQVTRHMIDLGFIRPDANTAIVARPWAWFWSRYWAPAAR